jgi:hypothetical protein
MRRTSGRIGSLTLAGSLALATALAAGATAAAPLRSELAVGEAVGAAGKTVVVQVKLRDRPGTPLGFDRPFGERIQALALKVRCLPEGAVEAVQVRRAGATAALTPLFEARPVVAGTASLLVSFDEARAPLPTQATARGERLTVARVEVRLARGLAPGTVVELRLDPEVTTVGNQAGTVAETVGNGWLSIRDGRIVVGE